MRWRAAPDPHLYAKTGVRWSEKMRVTMGTKLKPLRAPSQKRANSSRCSGAVALCAECPVLDEVDGLTALRKHAAQVYTHICVSSIQP